jgi:hypothetical protein
MLSVLLATVTVAGLVVGAEKVSDTPSMTSSKVLVSDSTARPLMVPAAFCAACVRVIWLLPDAGSKARRDRPAASASSPSSSVTPMRKPLALPEAADWNTSRAPLASLTMEAVTPTSSLALILLRTSSSVSSASMSMVTVLPLAVKLVWSAFQVPMSKLSVPAPTVLVLLPSDALAVICALASCVTLTL